MLALVGAMAIGVMVGRAPISGSCGGMKSLGLDMECEICGGDPELCDSDQANESANLPVDRRQAAIAARKLSERLGR